MSANMDENASSHNLVIADSLNDVQIFSDTPISDVKPLKEEISIPNDAASLEKSSETILSLQEQLKYADFLKRKIIASQGLSEFKERIEVFISSKDIYVFFNLER